MDIHQRRQLFGRRLHKCITKIFHSHPPPSTHFESLSVVQETTMNFDVTLEEDLSPPLQLYYAYYSMYIAITDLKYAYVSVRIFIQILT